MATITTILASDIIASSRVTLNTNFANLNTDKVDINSTYADPAWITSLAGSKVTGNIGGNAATATALATARTIAGVSFDGTANIAIPSTGLSDSSDIVRGASSVASGQVLYGTGAGVAGSEANLFWDAANDRLGVGTNTPADLAQFQSASGAQARLTIVAGATAQSPGLQLGWPGNTNAGIIRVDLAGANGGDLSIWSKATGSSVSEKVRVFGSGNVAIGTTTDDGTNRLQVAGTFKVTAASTAFPEVFSFGNSLSTGGTWKYQIPGTSAGARNGSLELVDVTGFPRYSISVAGVHSWSNASGTQLFSLDNSGTATLRSEIATTGVTQLIVRAGAGQSTTNLTTWQNASGSSRLLVTSSLGLVALGTFLSVQDSAGSINRAIIQSTMDVNSSYSFNFSSTTDAGGAKDLSLSRASANTLQVGDGGSNANGGLFASSIGVGVTPSIAANVNQVIIRAGAGQSTTNLQTWQNSGGTAVASVASNGTLIATGIVTSSAVFNSTNDLALDAAAGFSVLLRPNGGSERVRVGDTFIRTRNSQVFQFSSDATSFGTPDMGWSRNSSTAIEVNNGTAGTFRDLYLRGVRPVGVTVANLPTASGNTGMLATVTDATVTTIGTTVAGGGGNTVLVWSNGTNWRIYAN